MVVIPDHHDLLGEHRELVDEGRQDGLKRWRRQSLKQRQGSGTTAWVDALQCGERVGPKPGGIIVPAVQRDPGDWQGDIYEPGGEQGGLAKASRCGNEREWTFHHALESPGQVRARYQVRGRTRHIELGRQ